MKKAVFFCVVIFLLSPFSHADLITIGTATYNGEECNLIWDDDNNGKSLVWLDYSNPGNSWDNQMSWAADLESSLSINLDGYSVEWTDASWRLPSAGNPPVTNFTGDNIPESEMGHLFNVEFGLPSSRSGFSTIYEDDFDEDFGFVDMHELSWYWLEDDMNSALAYGFFTGQARQDTGPKDCGNFGIAVRTGTVTPVPEPCTFVLVSLGVLGIIGFRRRRK